MTDSGSVHETAGRIEVRSLKIENFKGCAAFELVPPPGGVALVGDNATGKTTVADAFAWALFGVDTSGNATFNILPLDAHGTPAHGLEASVELVFGMPDGQGLTLRRVFRETWTKRRGATTATRTGHRTKFWINGVPTKAGDYADEVEELLCEPSLFRTLTDPMRVARMHWRERRELLLGLAGEITLDDVVAADPDLAGWTDVLEGHEPDDARKVWGERRQAHNAEIARIPPAIMERESDRQEIDDPRDLGTLCADRDRLFAKATDLQERKAEAVAGGGIGRKRQELATAQAELLEAENDARTRRCAMVERLRKEYNDAQDVEASADYVKSAAKSKLRLAVSTGNALDVRIEAKRAEWRTVDRQQLEPLATAAPGDETCGACGQLIPATDVEANRRAVEERANADKTAALLVLEAEAATLVEERKAILAEDIDADGELRQATDDLEVAATESRGAYEALEAAKAAAAGLDPGPQVAELAAKAKRLQAAIDTLEDDASEPVRELVLVLDEVEQDHHQLEVLIDKHDVNKAVDARVQQLRLDERALARDVEAAERALWLLDRFTSVHAGLVSAAVNKLFEFARFQLFRTQINEGVQPVADITMGGVPWNDLNHGAQIQAGMDIVRTLQRRHGVHPPVWVDHGESVTSLPLMPCQLFRLCVRAGAPLMTDANLVHTLTTTTDSSSRR